VYRHILVPTDGTALSLKAAKVAARLAHRLTARITALHVIAPYAPATANGSGMIFYAEAYSPLQYEKAQNKAAAVALAPVRAAARALRVPCAVVQRVGGSPWSVIIKTARAGKCDLIVMASHGRRGFEGFLLGSETMKVLTHSKTPVLVCR